MFMTRLLSWFTMRGTSYALSIAKFWWISSWTESQRVTALLCLTVLNPQKKWSEISHCCLVEALKQRRGLYWSHVCFSIAIIYNRVGDGVAGMSFSRIVTDCSLWKLSLILLLQLFWCLCVFATFIGVIVYEWVPRYRCTFHARNFLLSSITATSHGSAWKFHLRRVKLGI